MLGNIGPMELFIVLLIVLVVFGAKRLPEMGASMGKGIREFKASLTGVRAAPDIHTAAPADQESHQLKQLNSN